jgi:hypothetical protein
MSGPPSVFAAGRRVVFGAAILAVALSPVAVLASSCSVYPDALPPEKSDGGVAGFGKYSGSPTERSSPWSSGVAVSVSGVYGDITVRQGTSGKVSATFSPFVYTGDPGYALPKIPEVIVPSIQSDASTIVFNLQRNGSDRGYGATIDVLLPPEYDAPLDVTNLGDGQKEPGNISIDFLGTAPSVKLDNLKSGECSVVAQPTLVSTTTNCGGKTTVWDVSSAVDIKTTGSLDGQTAVDLILDAVGGAGGSVETRSGNIVAKFPAGGAYTIQADCPLGGMVDEGSPACTVTPKSQSSKTIACGSSAPLYTLTAGTQGSGGDTITLSYQ